MCCECCCTKWTRFLRGRFPRVVKEPSSRTCSNNPPADILLMSCRWRCPCRNQSFRRLIMERVVILLPQSVIASASDFNCSPFTCSENKRGKGRFDGAGAPRPAVARAPTVAASVGPRFLTLYRERGWKSTSEGAGLSPSVQGLQLKVCVRGDKK